MGEPVVQWPWGVKNLVSFDNTWEVSGLMCGIGVGGGGVQSRKWGDKDPSRGRWSSRESMSSQGHPTRMVCEGGARQDTDLSGGAE